MGRRRKEDSLTLEELNMLIHSLGLDYEDYIWRNRWTICNNSERFHIIQNLADNGYFIRHERKDLKSSYPDCDFVYTFYCTDKGVKEALRLKDDYEKRVKKSIENEKKGLKFEDWHGGK